MPDPETMITHEQKLEAFSAALARAEDEVILLRAALKRDAASERRLGRSDGMLEAAAWLDDAAGQHVRGTEVWKYLAGAAGFMRQRAEEISLGAHLQAGWVTPSCPSDTRQHGKPEASPEP